MDKSMDELLVLAKEAAILGANALKKNDASLKNAQYGKSHDVKLKADKVAENQIVSFLRSKTKIKIISEETWDASPSDIPIDNSDLLWIIDPLDGSYNFLHDIPFYCISIGLWQGKEKPLLGVIYHFEKNEMFHGIVGKDTLMNDKKINVSTVDDISKAVLATGFPVNMDFSRENLYNFIDKVKNWGKIRLFGSAALSLAYVASGRVDAYREEDIMFWDVAAGIAIVTAAGGKVDFRFSDEKQLKMIVTASNKCLKLKSN